MNIQEMRKELTIKEIKAIVKIGDAINYLPKSLALYVVDADIIVYKKNTDTEITVGHVSGNGCSLDALIREDE